MPKITLFLCGLLALALSACQSPAQKFATETAQLDSLKTQINTMKAWFMVDERKVNLRFKHMQQQDSIIQLPNLASRLPQSLELDVDQYRAIPAIYQNYLQLYKQQQTRLDSLALATDSLQNILYTEKIGRRKFRELLAAQQQFTNALQTQTEGTVKKTIEVEPVFKRIQPHIDSLEKFAFKPGQLVRQK